MRLPDELDTLREAAPAGFAARVLDRVGVPAHRYDCYVRADSPVGTLYVAHGRGAVTGAAATDWYADDRAFEDAYRARTRRSALSGVKPRRVWRAPCAAGTGPCATSSGRCPRNSAPSCWPPAPSRSGNSVRRPGWPARRGCRT